jgi:hypothetical protein
MPARRVRSPYLKWTIEEVSFLSVSTSASRETWGSKEMIWMLYCGVELMIRTNFLLGLLLSMEKNVI